ncbi:MAG: T9SS type A sorting domain-containing protein [Bacteroidales bacterium]|nr:T9SS type A sorting domain-containing protein [Bacteroidales bacterium]
MDTVWIDSVFKSQYIYPPIADSNYVKWNLGIGRGGGHLWIMHSYTEDGLPSVTTKIAQRYEVDSIEKINGVALLTCYESYVPIDTFTVEIWDVNLTVPIFSKTVKYAGSRDVSLIDDYYHPNFIEVPFNKEFTLTEDYYIAVELTLPCGSYYQRPGETMIAFMYQSCYRATENTCTPYGCRTKYKPYVQLCHVNPESGRNEFSNWIHVDSVNWVEGEGYNPIGTYKDFYNYWCDTTVYTPIGICPIRVLEDTISNGGDSTNSALQLSKQLDEAVKLSPIPADEVLNIYSDYNILSVEVFDVMNRFIECKELNATTLQLNISKYQAGTYFIRIKTDKGLVKKKFIVS